METQNGLRHIIVASHGQAFGDKLSEYGVGQAEHLAEIISNNRNFSLARILIMTSMAKRTQKVGEILFEELWDEYNKVISINSTRSLGDERGEVQIESAHGLASTIRTLAQGFTIAILATHRGLFGSLALALSPMGGTGLEMRKIADRMGAAYVVSEVDRSLAILLEGTSR